MWQKTRIFIIFVSSTFIFTGACPTRNIQTTLYCITVRSSDNQAFLQIFCKEDNGQSNLLQLALMRIRPPLPHEGPISSDPFDIFNRPTHTNGCNSMWTICFSARWMVENLLNRVIVRAWPFEMLITLGLLRSDVRDEVMAIRPPGSWKAGLNISPLKRGEFLLETKANVTLFTCLEDDVRELREVSVCWPATTWLQQKSNCSKSLAQLCLKFHSSFSFFFYNNYSSLKLI